MLTRREVCQALAVSPKTLYLWERQGRIPPPRRTARGWRAYSDRDVARLRALLGKPAAREERAAAALPVAGLSARNQLRGTVVSIRGDRVLCEVVLRLGDGQEVSAVITRRSADRLGLRRGAEDTAVIKATEVMPFAAVLLLAACATTERTSPFTSSGGQAWPAPPEQPRIQSVTQFSGPADLGIRPSAWNRLVGFAAGPSERAMQRPMAVAATPAGNTVFVADPGAGVVHRYDLVRGRYDRLTPGRGNALASPVALAVTADGRVFVADSALNAVLSAGPEDDALQPLALTPEPEQPTGLALGPSGDLFFASTGSHTIRRCTNWPLAARDGRHGSDMDGSLR